MHQHNRNTRAAQNAADTYWERPYYEREGTCPSPSPSTGIEITDKDDQVWVVDDRYIMMMDRMIEQLEQWLDFEE